MLFKYDLPSPMLNAVNKCQFYGFTDLSCVFVMVSCKSTNLLTILVNKP